MKRHRQSNLLAYTKKGRLETEESDNPSSDSDLDDLNLDDPPTDRSQSKRQVPLLSHLKLNRSKLTAKI